MQFLWEYAARDGERNSKNSRRARYSRYCTYIRYSMHISFNEILSTWRVKCWEDTTSMRQGENLIFHKRRLGFVRALRSSRENARTSSPRASKKRNGLTEGRISSEKLEIFALVYKVRVIRSRRIAVISRLAGFETVVVAFSFDGERDEKTCVTGIA